MKAFLIISILISPSNPANSSVPIEVDNYEHCLEIKDSVKDSITKEFRSQGYKIPDVITSCIYL